MWNVREDIQRQYINPTSDVTFQDMVDRLNFLENGLSELLNKSKADLTHEKNIIHWYRDEKNMSFGKTEMLEEVIRELNKLVDTSESE